MQKRFFIIVLDSFGIGEMPDAADYGDAGSDTIGACCRTGRLHVPHMEAMGLFNIAGVSCGKPVEAPTASFARMAEASRGKDTTIGHWELAGVISREPLPTYPDGFPPGIIDALEKKTGRKMLCNKPYSGTQVIAEYGEEHMRTGALILYTSADSVLQIAAHEEIVPIKEQYAICEAARAIMQGEHGVGRIIARPFVGQPGSFTRTRNRHDFSLTPPADTMCDVLSGAGLDVFGVGKIYDIFAGRGITRTTHINGNADGMDKTLAIAREDFHGLCFVNLVDFDMLYGHRNDAVGYANALSGFDVQLGQLLPLLRPDDVLVITADHGCDPETPSTDHSREYVPMLLLGEKAKRGVNLGTRASFADLAATVQDYFALPVRTSGTSFWNEVRA